MATVFFGIIVHTKSFNEFESFENGFLAVDGAGKIIGLGHDYQAWVSSNPDQAKTLFKVQMSDNQFLMPGFVDCHIHAPQFAQMGLGLDMPLLDWLNTYTFPLEAKFVDLQYSQQVYKRVVEATVRCGTTLASYFATNHLESTVILAREAASQGQRALVGKVCSNCNSPDFYVETLEESVTATLAFVEEIRKLGSSLVLPTITPRFALSCSKELLKNLGDIAKRFDLHVQSHISENLAEIDAVKDIFNTSYAKAYDNAGLLTNKTVMAHGVHLEDDEVTLLKTRGCSVAHCPASNTMLSSGLCDVQRLVTAGITVGLGTDVSGGNSASIHNALLRALEVSKHISFFKTQNIHGTGKAKSQDPNYVQLKYKQALYMATLGGAKALSLDHLTGNFTLGKEFDALLVDVSVDENPMRKLSVDELIEKFIYTGGERNIVEVFVAGKRIKKECRSEYGR
ncbi:guanine deaminase [Drosophila eugracilis]|uniref:guanine deaminase n=1 Tax=Drosophila eugracilis TaxID=29029 RepID=UPI0007E7CE8E|nr:guanine deaminase [Drosophila eugracilis]